MCKSCFSCLSMNTNRWQDQPFFVGKRKIRSCTHFSGEEKGHFCLFRLFPENEILRERSGKKIIRREKTRKKRASKTNSYDCIFIFVFFYHHRTLFYSDFSFFLNRSLCNDATIFIWYLWNISRPNQKPNLSLFSIPTAISNRFFFLGRK